MKVEYDANVFGRGSEVPIYLHSQDVRELASRREELNITLIQLWMMYMFGVSNNLGYNDVYGFIDPQVIHETNDFDDITTYLTNRFGSGKEIYFIPYISGSAHCTSLLPNISDKQLIARMMLVGRSTTNGRKLAWVALKVIASILEQPRQYPSTYYLDCNRGQKSPTFYLAHIYLGSKTEVYCKKQPLPFPFVALVMAEYQVWCEYPIDLGYWRLADQEHQEW
ncbi:hypothetical protein LR48_Vigan04g151900 [Vigna angularis]|uniref:Ubiquitin-like protease family profile domain-containing protein n=1 Tax=Phaseolus angularis TaxID=3914 RepID=A0A0L9UF13_PHAAN|nr:hypothetical protein LR48_Vigan04g151900 [Vigna angularis]